MEFNKDDFVRPVEIAEVLGVTRQCVYKWIRRGDLTSVKVSTRRVLVPRAEFEALVRKIQEGAR